MGTLHQLHVQGQQTGLRKAKRDNPNSLEILAANGAFKAVAQLRQEIIAEQVIFWNPQMIAHVYPDGYPPALLARGQQTSEIRTQSGHALASLLEGERPCD